ncbi:MAG: metal ABC transporter ATP-binding protein [Anaerolineae bacterium]|nr:metal ABC transporter ATP-binding protein [Anaerolineae bacterium]
MGVEAVPAVELENVTVAYGRTVALENVSLRVAPHEFVGIVGPNGSGKTTLLRTILGLVRPVRGEVRVFGLPADALGPMRHRLGYVPQIAPVDIRFPVHVLDVVLMGRFGQIGLLRRPTAADREAAYHALERVGMQHLADRQIGQLSGGQRQRVFVARALAVEPELLLLDEPATGVDPGARGSLYELLNQLHQEGMTILMASHDVAVVSQLVDQVACVNRRVVLHGRPEEVLGDEALEGCYGRGAIFLAHGRLPHIVVKTHPEGGTPPARPPER